MWRGHRVRIYCQDVVGVLNPRRMESLIAAMQSADRLGDLEPALSASEVGTWFDVEVQTGAEGIEVGLRMKPGAASLGPTKGSRR